MLPGKAKENFQLTLTFVCNLVFALKFIKIVLGK